MSSPDKPVDEDAAMKARLRALDRDLAGHGTRQTAASTKPAGGMGQAVNLGARVMSEFVAAIAVGAFIGWQIDHWLGISPFGLILFVGLGTAAGFWSVYRVATKPGSK